MQTPTPNTSQHELAEGLRLVVGRLARRLRQESTGGVSLSQRSVLATLERCGPLRMGELARIESISPPSVTGIVDRLEARSLVFRVPDPDDARSMKVEITPEAASYLIETRRRRSAYLAGRISLLEPDQQKTLASAVEILDFVIDE